MTALLLALLLLLTSAAPWLSHVYFELAVGCLAKRFPSGVIETADLRFPVQNATTFLFPRGWVGNLGYIAVGVQWLAVVPVWLTLGWRWALGYAVAALVVVPVGAVVCEHSPVCRGIAAAIMLATLRRRVQRREFRWDDATNAEGEVFFEGLFRDVLADLKRAMRRPSDSDALEQQRIR